MFDGQLATIIVDLTPGCENLFRFVTAVDLNEEIAFMLGTPCCRANVASSSIRPRTSISLDDSSKVKSASLARTETIGFSDGALGILSRILTKLASSRPYLYECGVLRLVLQQDSQHSKSPF